MNILIAPNAFKGTLTAKQACDAIHSGMKKALPRAKFILCPLSDGGDGFVDVMQRHKRNIKQEFCTVTNPEGQKIRAAFLCDIKTKEAFIESAEASGMKTLKTKRRDILRFTSYGAGELILRAMGKGARKIIVGIGGTATNDAGLGLLRSLGFKFYSENGNEIRMPHELKFIRHIARANVDKRIDSTQFFLACDVRNVLLGKRGATYTYGRQKGADEKQLRALEEGIRHFAKKVYAFNKRKINVPFCGAGGGMAAAIYGLLNAKCDYGFHVVSEAAGLEEKIMRSHLVITGEGRVDGQTRYGKVPFLVAQCCKRYKIPCICIAGSVGEDADELHKHGMTAIFPSLLQTVNEREIKKNAAKRLSQTAHEIGRMLKSGAAL